MWSYSAPQPASRAAVTADAARRRAARERERAHFDTVIGMFCVNVPPTATSVALPADFATTVALPSVVLRWRRRRIARRPLDLQATREVGVVLLREGSVGPPIAGGERDAADVGGVLVVVSSAE